MIHRSLATIFTALLFSVLATSSCSPQTEEQALQSLRQMTKDGNLPAESVVENFERRFAGRLSGTLARLLHARIKFENKDFAGAAKLLDTEDFAKKTKLGDYALWLRGRQLPRPVREWLEADRSAATFGMNTFRLPRRPA